jgi:DNA polymerase III alpha subunit
MNSTITLDKPTGKPDSYPASAFDLVIQNGLDTLILVEDSISGFLQAAKHAGDNKVKLIFGLRMDVVEDASIKDDDSLKKRAKYIIFANNTQGYQNLIKIWSFAAKDGFYYNPVIDFRHLTEYWGKDVRLAVPFYDSFLYANAFESHSHVPQIEAFNPVFFTEDNDLPFDDMLKAKVEKYCKGKYEVVPAQSIYYKKKEDFLAYVAFRCLQHRGFSTNKPCLDRPELDHMGSDTFNFERWLKNNQETK